VRASLWCTRCWCKGHEATACDESSVPMVEPPKYVEELIPSDVRERWGITLRTPYIPEVPLSMEAKEQMISDNNTILIRYREGKQDSRIREVMRSLKIPTVHKMDGNITKLRVWAISQGKKVRLEQER